MRLRRRRGCYDRRCSAAIYDQIHIEGMLNFDGIQVKKTHDNDGVRGRSNEAILVAVSVTVLLAHHYFICL